jgi:hypothetical protein
VVCPLVLSGKRAMGHADFAVSEVAMTAAYRGPSLPGN